MIAFLNSVISLSYLIVNIFLNKKASIINNQVKMILKIISILQTQKD